MPRERLSPLDASFLYLDGEVACNQGVGYNLVDGPISFDRVIEDMRRKVRYVDRLRQCAVFSPFNLFHPTWEFDPEFDIRNHVTHTVIEPAGDAAQFRDTIARIFRTKLDRAHPLWAVHVINGAPGGRAAYIVVIHHCVSDGIGFAKLAMAFYDADRELRLAPYDPPREKHWPTPVMRIAHGLIDAIKAAPAAIVELCRGVSMLLHGLLREQGAAARTMLRQYREASSIRFAFNAPLSGEAGFSFAKFRLEDISCIRAMLGGTLNDVLLAVVGAALHRYAVRHAINCEGRYLRVLVPSNVRTPETQNNFGNFVSMAPVLVPLGSMPARERLAAVSAYTKDMKDCGLARQVSLGIALSQRLLTPPVSYLAHRLFSSLWMQRRRAKSTRMPRFNLVVTNVPGSPEPSYVAGHELRDVFVLVPLLASVGLCCGALSHNGTLYVSFSGDKSTAPDVDVLSEYMVEAFAELMAEGPVAGAEKIVIAQAR
ncbi:MAG: DUF1298 domain-containing protein [Candidatus Hydrogenedentes bacterium]|nr:DUF1298 domain-containing protein [Candidatus Hydrogenedentota bacterium]